MFAEPKLGWGEKKAVVVLVKFWFFSKMYNVVILAQWLRR